MELQFALVGMVLRIIDAARKKDVRGGNQDAAIVVFDLPDALERMLGIGPGFFVLDEMQQFLALRVEEGPPMVTWPAGNSS